jgi:molybdopterin molybdotransferase
VTASSLDEHRQVVASLLPTMPPLDIALADAHGGMLAADIIAERDVPEEAVAAADGYAVRAEDASGARAASPVALPVTHDASFDARGARRHVPGTAVRIASGAPMPRGADAVVLTAKTDSGVARVAIAQAPKVGQGVREQGFDVRAGHTVLRAGTRLGARHLALAATLGLSRLPVHPVPRVVVISVGDELIEPGEKRIQGGVAESSGHLIAALIREAGAHAYRVGVVSDDRLALRAAIEDQLVRADVVVTVGGLSGARNDTVAEVVGLLGTFDVGTFPLTPGGYHGVGSVSSGGRVVPVIGLPGRTVAAAVAFESYLRDALRAMSGHATGARPTVAATAAESWTSPSGIVQAVPVLIEEGGSIGATVRLVGDPAAPTVTDLAAANGLVLLPADATEIREGTVLRCIAWDA